MECELTNMIMIENPETHEVLALNRVKSWTGVSFPGGHVEKGESFTQSVIREAKEETGLDIKNPKLCGITHWCHRDSDARYIVALYKTSEYSGEILDKTEEGSIFWVNKSDFDKYKLSPNFDGYLKVFLSDKNESFGLYDDNNEDDMIVL